MEYLRRKEIAKSTGNDRYTKNENEKLNANLGLFAESEEYETAEQYFLRELSGSFFRKRRT